MNETIKEGYQAWHAGDTTRADELFQKAMNDANRDGDAKTAWWALHWQLTMYISRGWIARCEPLIDEVWESAQRLGDPSIEASACNLLGQYHSMQGHDRKAQEWLERGIAVPDVPPNVLSPLYGNLSGHLFQMLQPEKALTLYRRCVDIHDKTGAPDQHRGKSRIRLSYFQRELGQFNQSMATLDEAFDLLKDTQSRHDMQMVWDYRSQTFFHCGEFERAREALSRAIALEETVVAPRYRILQAGHRMLDPYFEDMEEDWEDLKDEVLDVAPVPQQNHLRRTYGEWLFKLGRFDDARTEWEIVHQAELEAGDLFATVQLRSFLADLELLVGNTQRAQELLEPALDLPDKFVDVRVFIRRSDVRVNHVLGDSDSAHAILADLQGWADKDAAQGDLLAHERLAALEQLLKSVEDERHNGFMLSELTPQQRQALGLE